MQNQSKPRIRVLTMEELRALHAAAETDQERDLVRLMCECGPRVKEIANMTPEDVVDDQVLFTGKTGPRWVAISAELAESLRVHAQGDVLWSDSQGKPLTVSCLTYRIRRLMQRAGITGPRCGPAMLRHTFATEWIRRGGSVTHLSNIMGHRSLDTTLGFMSAHEPFTGLADDVIC